MSRKRALLIFGIALVVRLLYVAQIHKAPYFEVPLVDGASYFRTAAAIAAGDLLAGGQAFWQPPLYPYVIALLLAVFGPGMTTICVVQSALGALSCVMVHRIGRRLFGESAALWAALVMAFYGPLIYFDAQPLIPVVHISVTLAGLLVMLRAAGIQASGMEAPPAPRRAVVLWGLAGGLWGLAAIATPNILLAAPLVAWWGMRTVASAPGADPAPQTGAAAAAGVTRLRIRVAAVFLLGVAGPIMLVAARNVAVAGELVLISSNGGINFYIGNNPDYEQTIRIRPGGEFERLAQEPKNLGIVSAGARSRFFTARALEFLRQHPGAALRLYRRKILDLVAGREIPRNQDPYVYRGHSWLLALLLWRAGVSFPFGVAAPLALAGVVAGRGDPQRRGRGLLLLYAAAYAASVVAFFPTARYRLPLVPVVALFAGRFLASALTDLRRRKVAVALVAGLVLFNLDALRPSESWPEEDALNRAYALRVMGRPEESRKHYRRALALNPRRLDAHNALAAMAAQEGRWEEAASHYRDLVDIAPDFVEVRRNLGQAYLALGKREEARREWQVAIHLAPGAAPALTDLCLSYLDEGLAPAAETFCVRAVRARPDLPNTHFALGLTARALRKRDLALAEFSEAARLYPAGSEGRRRAGEILKTMRRGRRRSGQE